MVKAVSSWPLTAEGRVLSQNSPRLWSTKSTGSGFPPSTGTSVLRCQNHPNNVPYSSSYHFHEKEKQTKSGNQQIKQRFFGYLGALDT
jgi:N-acetyl-gamma-glutamylphosphate reductase